VSLQNVLEEQIERNRRNIEVYKGRLESLPRGAIKEKKRGNKVYYYLQYRDTETGKVKDKYIKKEDLERIKYGLVKRKRFLETIKSLEDDIKIAERGLR
jgi:dTDP-4-amino-4,6-dideoxygalactose transaminase